MSSDVRLFESYEGAAEWLLLRPGEIEKVQAGEGFTEIFRADPQPSPSNFTLHQPLRPTH